MVESAVFDFVDLTYTGDYPVFVVYPYSLAICANADELAVQFAGCTNGLDDCDEESLPAVFDMFLADRCRTSFHEVHELDWTSLFPWSNPEPNCRFEVPYAIQCGAGFSVYQAMGEWLDYLESCRGVAASYSTFDEFARSIGVRILSDW